MDAIDRMLIIGETEWSVVHITLINTFCLHGIFINQLELQVTFEQLES